MPRKLIYIFTRDFSYFTNEIIRHAYVNVFPNIWGRGLEDQIVHYDGQTTRWYRYEDDSQALGDYMIHKDIDFILFQKETHEQFRQSVDTLRALLATPLETIHDNQNFWSELKQNFLSMYPVYTFSVFFAGVWRERFEALYGEEAKIITHRVYESRLYSEGLVKLFDIFVREWLSSQFQKSGLPPQFVKLLTLQEIESFVHDNTLPLLEDLEVKNKGYIFLQNRMYPTENVQDFLKQKDIFLEEPSLEIVTTLQGVVARKGDIFQGVVQVIFTSEEIKNFEPGRILVTPMTSPEYLPALKNAKAIITDEGGITCHAAIVARELNVPCIIGTKVATKILKDGDLVEVDANTGVIKKI